MDCWFCESERVWDPAPVHLKRAVWRHKNKVGACHTTAHQYQTGDRVWLSTRDIRLRLPCKKQSPCYIGPFPIIRQINEVIYELKLPDYYRISPSFHVSLLKPYTNRTHISPSAELEVPPPPEINSNETIFRVKETLDSQQRGGCLQYLVDCEEYGPEERSWVDRYDIPDPSLLTDSYQFHPDRPAPRGRGRPRHWLWTSRDAHGGEGTLTESPATTTMYTQSGSPDF